MVLLLPVFGATTSPAQQMDMPRTDGAQSAVPVGTAPWGVAALKPGLPAALFSGGTGENSTSFTAKIETKAPIIKIGTHVGGVIDATIHAAVLSVAQGQKIHIQKACQSACLILTNKRIDLTWHCTASFEAHAGQWWNLPVDHPKSRAETDKMRIWMDVALRAELDRAGAFNSLNFTKRTGFHLSVITGRPCFHNGEWISVDQLGKFATVPLSRQPVQIAALPSE